MQKHQKNMQSLTGLNPCKAITDSTIHFSSLVNGLYIDQWSRDGWRKINGRIKTLDGAPVRDSKLTLQYASSPRQ